MGEREGYYFLRFQKTGGTALTIRLRALFGADAVYPTTEDHGNVAAVFSTEHLVRRFSEHRDELRVISGHFPLCVIERLEAPFRTFTVLRDPIDRTLSLLRSRAQGTSERFAGRPLEEIYDHPEVRDIALDHMVKMLSLREEELTTAPLLQPFTADEHRLAQAKDNLDRIEVVGLQEDFDGFTARLEQVFGWDLGPNRFANRTAPQPVSNALRRRIAEDNRMDVELYEHARALVGRSRRQRHAKPEPKVVITGTGRAGTTLLVEILHELGLDTGVADGRVTPYRPSVRAGLESRLDDPAAPTVVKDMTLGFRLRDLLEQDDVRIRHVLIPDRDLRVATASRVRAAKYGARPFAKGGLTGTTRATEQRRVLRRLRAHIIEALDDHGIPYTILEFPRFANDAAYTRDALVPVLPSLTVVDVQRALDRCVHHELVHEAPLSIAERLRTWATTAWMVLVRYPLAAVRRRLDPEGQQARIRAAVAAARRREEDLAECERRAGRMPRGSAGGPTSSA